MKYHILFLLLLCINAYCSDDKPVTIAILAKNKAHCLPLYLACIENQTWPASKCYLYIRTNNNTDDTVHLLKVWIERVKDRYRGIYFDESDIETPIEQYGQHEWNYERLKILGDIRNKSIQWAHEQNSHYFVVDCDNFIFPHTLESLLEVNLPIVAPLLYSNCAYSNFHAAIDSNGYYMRSPFYLPILNREIIGLIQMPVVHCTYLIRHEVIPELNYDDDSYRYEYVIFSDCARKKKIPQYLDTRSVYGYLTMGETANDLVAEPWFLDFTTDLYQSWKSNDKSLRT